MPSRVLVVDDERAIRLFLEAILAREGYRVEVAANGEEALLRLRENEFDLLLVDLKMGAIDGLQVMTEGKELWPGMSVIVLTGHGSMDSAIQALRMGASDYLLKPCSTEELKTSARKALALSQEGARARELMNLVTSWAKTDGGTAQQRDEGSDGRSDGHRGDSRTDRAGTGEGLLRAGDLLFDRRRRSVTLRDTALSLTPTEYSLLLCLAENADYPVSSREIVLQVHGYQCLESEAGQLVKLHVKNLRQKIEPDPASPRYLRNVRGVGYMLCSSPPSGRNV